MLMWLSGKIWKVLTPRSRSWLARRIHPTFTASAAGVITNANGEVLLLNHVLRPRSGWGVPGGFLDKGEQPVDCMVREIREESGIEAKNPRLVRIRTVRRHIEILYAAEGDGEPTVNSAEITEAAWFKIDEMPPEMSRSQRDMIRDALGR